MARKSFTFCKYIGCNELTRNGYCDRHKEQHEKEMLQKNMRYNKLRGGSTKAGYGYDWQKVRLIYLKAHPLCEDCEKRGVTRVAALVDHIIPIKEGGKRLDVNNLRSKCNDCHEKKHGKDRWKRRR